MAEHKELYPLTPEFEAVMSLAECVWRPFHGLVGHAVDTERLSAPQAKLIFKAARHVIQQSESVSPTAVLQKLRTEVYEGKITIEDVNACFDYLEFAEAQETDNYQLIVDGLTPILREFGTKDTVLDAFSSMGRNADPERYARTFDKVASIGKGSDSPITSISGSVEDIVASNPRIDAMMLPTGIDELDSMIGGGLPAKKLGCVLANSNDGKSFFLGGIFCESMLLQYPSLYISLEMEEVEIKDRVYRNLTDMTADEIAANPEEAARRYRMLQENGMAIGGVKYMTPYETTPRLVEEAIEEFTDVYRVKPKTIVIDYADLVVSSLSSAAQDNGYRDAGKVYAKFRSIAIRNDYFMWTASQATRESVGRKHIGQKGASDSMEKVRKSDFMIAICRTEDDRVRNQFRIAMPKRRMGQILPDIGPLTTDWDYGRMVPALNRFKPWEVQAA